MTPDCIASRRKFLKTSLLGGAAALAAWRLPLVRAADPVPAPPLAPAAPVKFSSRVALTTGEDRANLAFKALEPFKNEIAAAIGNRRVILKPNNVTIDGALGASSADNLEGILEFLKSIGKRNVVIAESPAGGSALDGFANYGYNKFVGQYGVKLVNLDTEGFEVLQVIDEKDFRPHPCRVSKLLLDQNNFIISAAKLKTHDLAGITLSLKNIVVGAGIKAGKSDKPLMHGGGYHGIRSAERRGG